MKIQELGMHEMARSGFTHKAILSVAQGDFSAAALTQTIDLFPIPVGWMLRDAASRVVTPLSGGTIATAAMTLGDSGVATGLLTSTDIFTGTSAVVKAGDGAIAAANGKAYATANVLRAGFTTTVGNLNAAIAGEIHLYFSLFKLLDL